MTARKLPVPTNLESLRQLLIDLESGTAPIRLGAQSRRVLALMLEQSGPSALASITELAERYDVNPSTLSRLAQRLGFSGFGGLQELFRNELTDGGSHFYSDQASALNATTNPELDLLMRLSRQEHSNITGMVENMDGATFHQATELLAQAPRVRVFGMRQFYALSYFLAYGLGMIRSEVAPLNPGAQGLADALSPLESEDLLVVSSCFPYTSSVIRTAEIAIAHGVKVIALTDSTTSPLARIATHTFTVPSQSVFYSNSMAGFFVLSEALLSETARKLGDKAVDSLRRREALISELAPLN
jgi:DNA-binding MurR/RpiR family transcriptional regulator